MAGAVAGGTTSACSNALAAPMHDGGSSSNSRSGSGSAEAAAVTAAAAAAAAGNAYAFHGWRSRIHQSPWHSHDSCAPGRLQRYFICGRQTEPTEERYTAATEAVFRPLSCLSPSRIAIKGVRDAVVCARRDGSRGDGASTAHVEHMFTLTPAEASREPSAHGSRSWSTGSAQGGGMWGSIESADSSVLSAFPPSMYSKCMQRKGENKQRQRFVCLSRRIRCSGYKR